MNMPPFLRDSIYSQNQFQLKIIKWLELGNLHKLNNNEMLCIGKVQYLSFLWKCYSDNKINFLTPYVNNQFISSVFKISSQDHKNRRWQRNDINNLIYPFDKNKKYFFRSNNVAIVEGLKIDSKYGFNEVKRCNKNKFIRFIGNIYFQKFIEKLRLNYYVISHLKY